MPESQQSEPEKTPKTRSFGSFLLFLVILVVTLVLFGKNSLNPPTQFTQDQYLWHLHTGAIQTQEFRGTPEGSNLIEGTYHRRSDGELRPFEVSFADLGAKEEELREIKAEAQYTAVSQANLEAAVAGGWYKPFAARTLTGYREVEIPATASGGEADGSPKASPNANGTEGAAGVGGAGADAGAAGKARAHKSDAETRLFVGVTARSRDAWTAAVEPRFPLPEVSRQMWVEVLLEPHYATSEVPDLGEMLAGFQAAGVPVTRQTFDLTADQGSKWKTTTSPMMTFLIYAGPWVLIFLVFMFFMRQMRSQGGAGGVMSFGRSRAQLYTKENHTNVTFDDMAGAEEAKSEVREIVEFLKNPGRFTRIGGHMPRGVLLVGPPGCGKTLLAKAIAGEAEVPFFSISGSDFVEMFVGVGASRVRDLFKQARDNSPCIIFLDEIDAVGRRRGSGMGGGHDEREQTLNAILVEMDGFSTDKGIIVLAATNRPDVLDPALLRPGRFDREVTIDLPDLEGRRQILSVHLKRVKHDSAIDLDVMARSTPGYSGADLAAIVNEAAIMAVLDKREEVSMSDMEEARDKVRYGRQKKSRKVEEEDRKITAYHEAGHAVVAARIPEVDHPHKVTIVPRGRALGATMMLPDKESYHMQKKRLLGQLAVLFGGRVAEQEFCGDISAGASDDISRATDLARTMVTELGMSEKIGPINYAERQGSDFLGTELMRGKLHSEDTAREIDNEVHLLLEEAYERAEQIIRDNRDAVEVITEALLVYENVTGQEITRVLGGAKVADLRPEAPETVRPEPQAKSPAQPREGGETAGEDVTGDFSGSPGLSPA